MAFEIPEIKSRDGVPTLELPEDECTFLSTLIRQANKSFGQRQGSWAEFDDMTYDQSYVSSAKATNAYIPPKINQEDVRTVSGVTREKSNTLTSALLNYNLKPNVMAFDEMDLPALQLGDTMTDAIGKSRRLELPVYDSKRPDMIQELVDQGTVFVEDRWIEYSYLTKEMKDDKETDMLRMKWDTTAKYVMKQASCDVLYGPSVYLGNMRQRYFQLQPYVFVRKELTRGEAEAHYSDWARWKNVGWNIKQTISTSMNGQVSHWGSWTMTEVSTDMVEEIKYFNPWTNTYQVILQGTPMLKPGFPLSFLTGQCRIPIACGKLEPIPNFAYGRGFGHKNKFNQALYDEMYKGIVLKMRKSYNPPMANNSGMVLSKRIFFPANITNNLDASKLQEIGNNSGISASDTNALAIIKEVIDDSSVTAQFQGQGSKGDQTARETVELKQQQLMKLGLAIIGLMNLEVELAWLRLFLILRYWTQPMEPKLDGVKKGLKDQYRQESMDSDMDDGQTGKRILRFVKGEPKHPDQLNAEAALLSKRRGVPIKIVELNTEELEASKFKWFIDVMPEEKETSDLRAAIFMDNLTNYLKLFGPQSLNLPYAQKRWTILNHEDPEKFLAPAQPQGQPGQQPPQGGQPPMPGMPPQGNPPGGQPSMQAPPPQAQQGGAPMPQPQIGQPGNSPLQSQMQPKQLPKPSLNTLATS